jgi:hypothetical protein
MRWSRTASMSTYSGLAPADLITHRARQCSAWFRDSDNALMAKPIHHTQYPKSQLEHHESVRSRTKGAEPPGCAPSGPMCCASSIGCRRSSSTKMAGRSSVSGALLPFWHFRRIAALGEVAEFLAALILSLQGSAATKQYRCPARCGRAGSPRRQAVSRDDGSTFSAAGISGGSAAPIARVGFHRDGSAASR